MSRERLTLATPEGLPYSKGVMARALMATGVPAMRAYELATRLEADLRSRGSQSVDVGRLEELASEVLGDAEGARAARRLHRYQRLRELDLPIIVLVGGGTGTGKSTVATEIDPGEPCDRRDRDEQRRFHMPSHSSGSVGTTKSIGIPSRR